MCKDVKKETIDIPALPNNYSMMISYAPRHVYTVRSTRVGSMSATPATPSYRVYPYDDFVGKTSPISTINTTQPQNTTSTLEREIKKIVRQELHHYVRMAGMSQMMDSKEHNNWKKFLWFSATLACLVASTYFVTNQTHNYLQEKTSLKSSLADSIRIKVPAITLCPGVPVLYNSKVTQLLKEKCKSSGIKESECEVTPFKDLGLKLEDFWKVTEYTTDRIHISVQCPFHEVNITSECKVPNQSTRFDSYWGKCRVFAPQDKQAYYRGPHSYFNITIENRDEDNVIEDGNGLLPLINIYLHNDGSTQSHLSYFKSLPLKETQFITLSIKPKEFSMLSKNKRKCHDTNETRNCPNRCFDSQIADVMQCRLPFVQSEKAPPCKNFKAALQALQEANIYYRNITKLSCKECPKRCYKVMYDMTVNNIGPTEDKSTQLLFYYHDSTWEVVEEKLDYPFQSYLSEIGGVLGFFLGFSVLGTLEIIQHVFYCCKRVSGPK